ncbi:MAG: hypothetical protein JKP95_00525 [Oceanicaulis sp.]|nr:hypothetical protein [Oceanicaulis sp.]
MSWSGAAVRARFFLDGFQLRLRFIEIMQDLSELFFRIGFASSARIEASACSPS